MSMEGQVPPYGRIMVGFDGSPASVGALRWAAAEARLRRMRLHVVHVRDRKAVVPAHYALPGARHHAADCAGQESALRALIDDVLGPDARPAVELEFADGLPARVLLDRTACAAMLVLGSTRSSGLDAGPVDQPRAPLGPVARECLRAALCPVVIVTSRVSPPAGELAHAG
jgi:nucleotide-binding universal stress UspA family protein